MVRLARAMVFPLVVVFSLLVASAAGAQTPLPNSMASLGDSITRAADVCCWYGDHPHESWSTGDNPIDGIHSQYERLKAVNPTISGHAYNDAVSGAKASDLAAEVAAAVAQKPDYVTLLIGANDLCTSSAATMTSTDTFSSQINTALATLHQALPAAHIFVSSIPNLYQLRSVLHGNWLARAVWSTAGICQSMLASSDTEAQRQQVVAREAAFNEILANACDQYSQCRWDGYATYHYAFAADQISKLDFFHPDLSGQKALAELTWNASWWGAGAASAQPGRQE
jgi:lysophospholipase L1-like esterase